MANFYPIFMDIRNRNCIVVGGGSVAERKVISLLECGALVTVVSPALTDCLSELAREGGISHLAREYRAGDLDGAALVVAATDDGTTNEMVFQHGLEGSLLVNVVDKPDLCNFIVPSVVRRGDLTIAISTSGKSPAMAKWIRQEIESAYPDEFATYLDTLADVRAQLRKGLQESEERESAWRRLMATDLMGLVKTGRAEEISQRVKSEIELLRKERGVTQT